MRLVALRAVARVVSATVNAPSLADDAPANSAAMSHGWQFAEQGGADLFRNVCAACHQPDAKGATGAASYPALTDNKDLASAEYLETLLFNGQRAMPPLGWMMSDQQVADVINYVRTHFGNDYHDLVSAATVKAARPQSVSDP